MESADPHLMQLLRICQLASPALPIGAFNFSQGLEYAVDAGWVKDEGSANEWLNGIATHAQATLDVPILIRLQRAWNAQSTKEVDSWSAYLMASRESAELRAEDRHTGQALAKVLVTLEFSEAGSWIARRDATLATLFALACARWSIDTQMMASGYLWMWAENQVLAAVKLVPLGQSSYVRMLAQFAKRIPQLVEHANSIADEDIGIATPMQGVASAAHETQYTRLFRS
jgi:urease accessory protein